MDSQQQQQDNDNNERRNTYSIHRSTSRVADAISTRGIQLSDREVEAIMAAFETDENKEKTFSRWLVETYLQNYSWYFPRKDIPGGPSLQKAWAYYEHVTLPRHFVGETAGNVLRRAEPGEQGDTELYAPRRTHPKNWIEFGIGVDLYFQTCAAICLMFLLAGIVNIPNIYYFASASYNSDGGGQSSPRGWALEGSAVCTNTYWAVCADCQAINFQGEAEHRFAVQANNTDIKLVLRNDCDIGAALQGIVNWSTWVFFALFLTALSIYLRAREIRFDEDKLTASDYSIVVKNPPPDALDPQEWRDYFTQFAEKQVTVISIHLNNEPMLNKLVERRKYKDLLRRLLPKGTDMEDESTVRIAVDTHVRVRDAEPKGCFGMFLECTVFWPLYKLGVLHKAETLVDKVYSLTGEIQELQKQRYEVSKVYATFETEEGQRAALTALTASKFDIMTNNTQSTSPSAVFHDRVLRVVEPTEPSAVRWTDLSATKMYRTLSTAATLCVTVGLCAVAGILEDITRRNRGARSSGVLVAVFNAVIPEVVRRLMVIERHQTEGEFQSSLYLKITLFRWVNTAIILLVITPFTSTLGDRTTDLLPSVSAILWSETFITPALRILDGGGFLQKHILAPRAMTQEQMNLNFLGTPYNLGERYTDLTKVLFVCFFYSALFPASFLFGFVILLVQYHVDKFCLLRIWGFSPSLGNSLAVYSRRYFFTGATVAFIIASAYAWAQFPYDNVCDTPETRGNVTRTKIPYTVFLASETESFTVLPEPKVVFVEQEEPVYYCPQGFMDRDGFAFPPRVSDQPELPMPLRWMTESQELLVDTYFWSVIVALVLFFVGALSTGIWAAIRSWWSNHYEPEGASQKIDFSCTPDIVAYVPHVKLRYYPFPFLAANVDDLDEDLLGFTDPEHGIDEHNMIFDVPYDGMHRRGKRRSSQCPDQSSPSGNGNGTATPSDDNRRPIFGICKHYPPSWWEKQYPRGRES